MNSLHPVDFETFYFFSLLDLIKKSGKNKLDDSMQKNLGQFVDFLETGETPIDSIERIARFQRKI